MSSGLAAAAGVTDKDLKDGKSEPGLHVTRGGPHRYLCAPPYIWSI